MSRSSSVVADRRRPSESKQRLLTPVKGGAKPKATSSLSDRVIEINPVTGERLVYDTNAPNAGLTGENLRQSSTYWWALFLAGLFLFGSGVFVLIWILTYRIGGALPWSPLAYYTGLSGDLPSEGYWLRAWNALIALSALVAVLGFIYLVAIMRNCWEGIFLSTWSDGANSFRLLLFLFVHTTLLFFVQQIAGIQNWATLFALFGTAILTTGLLYVFEAYNRLYMQFAQLYDNPKTPPEEKRLYKLSMEELAVDWVPYVFAWFGTAVIWITVFIYMGSTLTAITISNERYWIVLSIPLVAGVFTVVRLVAIGARYTTPSARNKSHWRYCRHQVFEVLDLWVMAIVVPVLYTLWAMFAAAMT